MHAVVGAVTGNLEGALGAAGSAYAAKELKTLQASLREGLDKAGLGGKDNVNDWSSALSKLATGALATGIGAAAGSGFEGAAAGLNQDYNNRQAHPDQLALVKDEARKLAGQEELTEQQWEARLTQQLLLQSDSAYAGGRRSEGNDAVAEQILKDAERASGLKLDYRNTAEYREHTINTEFLNQTIDSYKMVGAVPSGGYQRSDGSWQATLPGSAPGPTGFQTTTKYPVEGCKTAAGDCTYTFFANSDRAYMLVPKADGTSELYEVDPPKQTTLAALQAKNIGRGCLRHRQRYGPVCGAVSEGAMLSYDLNIGTLQTLQNVITSLQTTGTVSSDVSSFRSSTMQWLASGKAADITAADIRAGIASWSPVYQTLKILEDASSTDPGRNVQAGTDIGTAAISGVAGKAVEIGSIVRGGAAIGLQSSPYSLPVLPSRVVGSGALFIDNMGTFTAAGSEIFHGAGITRIGSDAISVRVSENVAPLRGFHDVVVHGIPYDEIGAVFFVDNLPTNTRQIAEAIKTNPTWEGQPIRLLTCYGGCGSLSPAQELSTILNTPVRGATNAVGVPRVPGSSPIVRDGGSWIDFVPK